MRELNPTLWRTCRVLAGPTRLRFLRQLQNTPGQNESMLAQAVQVGLSDASQELRRLQSRGLLQVDRQGRFVYFRLGADPQVPSAAPLLKAIKSCLSGSTPEQDEVIIRIATGLAHARRVAIARELIQASRTAPVLQSRLQIPQSTLCRHLGILQTAGFARCKGRVWTFQPGSHPLAQTLARLLME